MKHIKFTYVDSLTGVCIKDSPAANGPAFPAVPGLSFEWARQSQYPTNLPEFFGTCSDEGDITAPGVLGVFNQADWEQMQADEMLARDNAVQGQIVKTTQQRLDDFANTRNYSGILSACTYATSTHPKFQAEGQYCVQARDSTWAKLYEILAEVEAGERPVPAGYAEIESELPVLEWNN